MITILDAWINWLRAVVQSCMATQLFFLGVISMAQGAFEQFPEILRVSWQFGHTNI